MLKASQSIINFLTAKRDKGKHNGPDLLTRYLQHGIAMETQVNVAAGDGEPVGGKRACYSDGCNEWFSFRIPKNADSNPVFNDYNLKWPLDLHAESIGSTGWDWKARRSRWVGFDFDSVVGHASGTGMSAAELDEVRERAIALPYVEARLSTGGAGLHLYVMFADEADFDTANHTEHQAIARCILGVMSEEAGFDFQAKLDVCGGNMWIWHRKSTPQNNGLKLLKAADVEFPSDKLPANWRDHIDVVKGGRPRVRIGNVGDTEEDIFSQLTSAHRREPLDDTHKAIMEGLRSTGVTAVWVPDYHLLQTHTVGFQRLSESGEYEGKFDTVSKGSNLAEANCFAYPMPRGGWRVYRFGLGTHESPGWEQDGKGYTYCTFNATPSFKSAARGLGGKELAKGGYEFPSLKKAIEVAKLLNPTQDISIEEDEERLAYRKAIVKKTKDGKLAIETVKEKSDPQEIGDWNNSDRATAWTKVFGNVDVEVPTLDNVDYDEHIRALITPTGDRAGWVAKIESGEWVRQPKDDVKSILLAMGHTKAECDILLGTAAKRSWKLVTVPFADEYPGDRLWNRDAPQLRFQPTPRDELVNLEDTKGRIDNGHPHWDKVLDHVGGDLTPYLQSQSWAKECNIRTGGDYLCAIMASIIRHPEEPTPYLFLFGPENSGKSIFHEAFELLVTRGVVLADRALTSQNDFNGELEGAILCVVEEKDLSQAKGAMPKIKAAVTSPRLSIRRMRMDSYMVNNTTHWVQCANHRDACPVFEGDTRITMIHVPQLPLGEKGKSTEIPKTQLLSNLKKEAPHFMRTLMDINLPGFTGRLRVPVVSTEHKNQAEMAGRSALQQFIQENLYLAPGKILAFSEFYKEFTEWLPPMEKGQWSRTRVSRSMPDQFQTGVGNSNKTFIINASLYDAPEPTDYKPAPYYIASGRVKRDT